MRTSIPAIRCFVDEDEEKCLVLDNRSAETHSKLIAVLIILARAGEIVEPRIGVTCRVAVRPKRAAAILVAARPGYLLDLACAAVHLRIHRRRGDANLV